MTSISKKTTTTIRHQVIVPSGSPVSELQLALHWAHEAAVARGVATECDDWAYVTVADDAIIIESVEHTSAR